MASTALVKVMVQELTRYGFKANNKYVGWSKNFKDADKAQVVPGREFEMEFYTSDSGKEYCNKIIGQMTPSNTSVAPKMVAPVFNKTPKAEPIKASFVPSSNGTSLSKEEWADKDRRISRQGCIQAAVQAVSHLMATEEDLFDTAKKLADQMLNYVNEVK